MTLLPHDNWNVVGVEGQRFKASASCCVPRCPHFSDHAHHIWRRSFLSGDYAWVRIWDGTVVGNLCGLCWRHHEAVTVGKARIIFLDATVDGPEFFWSEARDGLWTIPFPLDPQPPLGALAQSNAPNSEPEGHSGQSAERCPTCGHRHRKPAEELPPGEKRRRKTWPVKVPDDGENGAAVLDELEAEVAEAFQIEHYSNVANRRYFSIAQAFALVLQEQHDLG